MWLLILLIGVPILEISLFIQVGGAIGTWPTIAIVILTAIVGSILLRSQGLATFSKLQGSLAGQGGNPMTHIAHGALILVSGVVLLTPGFFTDAVGIALLFPPVRAAVIKFASSRVSTTNFTVNGQQMNQGHQSQYSNQSPSDPTILEGEFEELDETPQEPGNSGWTKH